MPFTAGFWRFAGTKLDIIYGGGEANVATSLVNYRQPVEYVTRLPVNDTGDACLN
jgi:2-dehydro-3-deoxygluconokinase